MQLTRQSEEQLKRLKIYTGITPNVAARLAFFRSMESGFRYHSDERKLDGSLILDKITWLGDTVQATELLLKIHYPQLNQKEIAKAWAAHVEDGMTAIRSYKNLKDFTFNI
ncbi:DNA sulfur modification protein DndE [Azotobacter chroococcum]|uniref:DNA sulfur modification protein DndE n=1 Tax=Azotobacter chroococcum TaxID=353 RepID=A0AAP9YCM2_9GAMM|nr:DNA sulfur modification protein DndE [Azotobacter chroococcum]QQE88561.1 DNA sulfur modification protein DndE [Azotobacter chroococcum]